MTQPREGEAVWKFAIMFQIGMILVAVVLIVLFVLGGPVITAIFGVVLAALAIAGIYYARRTLRELRK